MAVDEKDIEVQEEELELDVPERSSADELLDAGDRVVALIDQRMRGRSTGIEVSRGKYAQVASYRDGLLVRWRFYGDQAEALEAVGLSQ